MKISGFTFIHNAIESGYPIVESIRAVQPYVDEVCVVNMQSTDQTRQVLEAMAAQPAYDLSKNRAIPLVILKGYWGYEAGETLRQAHRMYKQCSGDIIVHFEADEVFEPKLMKYIIKSIETGVQDIAVHRLQVEQNFQRCRWYPEPVHRVFPKQLDTIKDGHTTNRHNQAVILGPECGYLWDVTNCFRDNWMNRVKKQAALRASRPQYLMTPIHCTLPAEISEGDAARWLYGGRHWEWTATPFDIPNILRPLVGMVKYEPNV